LLKCAFQMSQARLPRLCSHRLPQYNMTPNNPTFGAPQLELRQTKRAWVFFFQKIS
jgi:hypothetical protein